MKSIILLLAFPVESNTTESLSALIVHVVVMILAGIYGGIINYFLESEKAISRSKLTIWQMIVIGIGASFLVPLFLTLISSNLVNLKQLEFSKILVFFGFCLIAAISSRRFIMTISERLLREVREAKDVAAQAQEAIAEKEKQEIIDQEAMELVQKFFEEPDPDETQISAEDLKEKIKSSSVSTRASIFFEARKFRRDNYKKYPEKIERLVPIFEALIESDDEEIYHRNYAQLGYILKDKKIKEYDRARVVLSKAIEIRDRLGETGFNIYEFNRAICNIETDPDFKNGQPSSEQVKKLILDDFRKAFQIERWKNAIERDLKSKTETSITKWLKLNNVDLKHFD
jgi:tetratricopeptide (TPR) repeat protein